MFWANFLHIYQPPTQSEQLVKKIAIESYLPIIAGLEKTPQAKLTLNINGSLTELLVKIGFKSLLKRITKLAKSGQIELTGSAKYHPILPLLPEAEIIRQIKLNFATNRKYFGPVYNPIGFFPPEMAYSAKLGKILAKLGFGWVIVDEIVSSRLNRTSFDRIYYQEDFPSLRLLLRSRRISNFIARAKPKTGRALVYGLRTRAKGQKFIITALDGETFGHHNKNYDQVLFEAYHSKKLMPLTLSELVARVGLAEKINPTACSWSSSESELRRGTSFNLWHNRHNTLHKLQWQLTHLAQETVEKAPQTDPGYAMARHWLDQALHSDQYWWASGSIVFGSYLLWSVEMIEGGAKFLRQAVCDLHTADKTSKDKAHQLYDKIVTTAFYWQRKGIIAQKRAAISKRLGSSKRREKKRLEKRE